MSDVSSISLPRALAQLSLPIELVNADGRTTHANQAFSTLTGYPAETLIGQDSTALLRYDNTSFRELHRSNVVQPRARRTEECVRPDGSEWLCETSVYALTAASDSKEIACYIVHRCEISVESAELRPVVTATNDVHDHSLGQLGHDLRAPLNAIVGYSEILLEDAIDADRSQDAADLRTIRDAGRELQTRITDAIAELDRRITALSD